ncbi:hypothetical protein U27_06981 [Candidatus Vecturithrix granuli]|uniref:Uncharacterized protein n=1 Tax=Vecturithrix granuli TaxID=1499967 RepID=A0A081C5Y9_VECG1|nr:hypothetical protein U27_06981 [Candidatus Vecturithrix granuli]
MLIGYNGVKVDFGLFKNFDTFKTSALDLLRNNFTYQSFCQIQFETQKVTFLMEYFDILK